MSKTHSRVFITDCEGPITKNDNAAELAEAFIPKGDVFFQRLSLYDDYLAEIERRPNYKAGDTLRLILPFFKAFGLDDRSMTKFARRSIEIIPNADRALKRIASLAPAYIVSTSYVQYINAVCDAIEFPFSNTYSTLVNIDDYDLSAEERQTIKDLHQRILSVPDFSLPQGAHTAEELPETDRSVIAEYNHIFWDLLPQLDIYRLIREINPVGGMEKATAVVKITELENVKLEDVLYVGDSITDIEAFRMVKAAGGVAVAFNGNDWAVQEASFGVTSRTADPLVWLTTLFIEEGPSALCDLFMSETKPEILGELSRISCRVRKTVRTEKIGGLG